MFEWFRKNILGSSLWLVAAGLAVAMLHMQGCQLTDLVPVDVPEEVQRATGAEESVSLTEAPMVAEDYARAGAEFGVNIDEAYERFGFVRGLIETGVELGSEYFPGGGVLLSALFGFGGLLMKGPGTSKEKEESFNAGLERGQANAERAIRVAREAGLIPPDTSTESDG